MDFLQDVMVRGGPVMWPLLLCSVVSLTIVLERLIFWARRHRSRDEEQVEGLLGEAERGRASRADALDSGRRLDPAVRVVLAGVEHAEWGLSEAMEIEAEKEVSAMKQGLRVLDTIITLAPLLGILGTVTGIIRSFNLLGAGVHDASLVTPGIAEALITTAAGLVISIGTLIPYNYLCSMVQTEAKRLQEVCTRFEIAWRKRQSRQGHGTGAGKQDQRGAAGSGPCA